MSHGLIASLDKPCAVNSDHTSGGNSGGTNALITITTPTCIARNRHGDRCYGSESGDGDGQLKSSLLSPASSSQGLEANKVTQASRSRRIPRAFVLACLVSHAAATASSPPDPSVHDTIVSNATALRAAIEDGRNRRVPLALHVIGRIALGEAGLMELTTFLVAAGGQLVTLWSQEGEGILDAEYGGRIFSVRQPCAYPPACPLSSACTPTYRSQRLHCQASPASSPARPLARSPSLRRAASCGGAACATRLARHGSCACFLTPSPWTCDLAGRWRRAAPP